jgi:phosphomethylpyrimidine synthase
MVNIKDGEMFIKNLVRFYQTATYYSFVNLIEMCRDKFCYNQKWGDKMAFVTLRGKKSDVMVGSGFPIAVNVNIGVSNEKRHTYEQELEKISCLAGLADKPDTIMDLSLCSDNGYLYDHIREQIGCPIGYIPHYICINEKGVIDKARLKEEMIRAAIRGVSWFVIHLTPTAERVIKTLKLRKIPFSSRSAVVIIKDMINRNAKRSIYWDILADVIEIAKKYSVTISLGAAFRPAVINDTLDEVHAEELLEYIQLVNMFKKEGVSVMTEGVGHCNPNKLNALISMVNKLDVPFMPLGPLLSDDFFQDDHIINAIGFYSAVLNGGNFNIINSITPSEHSGGIPDIRSILTGYNTARSCANLCNNFLGVGKKKQSNNICSNPQNGSIGCSRCEDICPTKFFIDEKEKIEQWVQSY